MQVMPELFVETRLLSQFADHIFVGDGSTGWSCTLVLWSSLTLSSLYLSPLWDKTEQTTVLVL